MKKLLITLAVNLVCLSVFAHKPDSVYLCVSKEAVAYHQTLSCRGLRSCKHRIIKVQHDNCDYNKLTLGFLTRLLTETTEQINHSMVILGWSFDEKRDFNSNYSTLVWTLNRDIDPQGDTTASEWLKVTKKKYKTTNVRYQFESKSKYSTIYSQLLSLHPKKFDADITPDNAIETLFIANKIYYTVYCYPNDTGFEIEISNQ